MKLEILSSDYSSELVEHPDGWDVGGHLEECKFECVVKTSYGTVYYESSYTDTANSGLEKFDISCSASSPLGVGVANTLEQLVRDWAEDKDTHVGSCCGEYTDTEISRLLESKFREFEDYPPSPEIVDDVIRRMTPEAVTVEDGVAGVEFFGTFFTNLDDVNLDKLLWEDDELYSWHEELQENESVMAAFNQAMDRMRDQFKSRREELDAEIRHQKRDQQLKCLREFFQSKVLDLVKEQDVIDSWREVFNNLEDLEDED